MGRRTSLSESLETSCATNQEKSTWHWLLKTAGSSIGRSGPRWENQNQSTIRLIGSSSMRRLEDSDDEAAFRGNLERPKMKVLVTGAAGFLASHLIPKL